MNMHSRSVLRTFKDLGDLAARQSFLRLQQNRDSLVGRKMIERGAQLEGRLAEYRGNLGTRLGRGGIDSWRIRIIGGTREWDQSTPPFVTPFVIDAKVD